MFTSTKYANLVRYKGGTYYLHAKVGGKKVFKSLGTTSATVAQRLRDIHLAQARNAAGKRSPKDDRVTFAGLIPSWRQRLVAKGLKPRSLDYREETVQQLLRAWPELSSTDPATLTPAACLERFEGIGRKFSPSRFNGILESFRGLIKEAVRCGVMQSDPSSPISRKRLSISPGKMPNDLEVAAFLGALEGEARRKKAQTAARLMLTTGLRVSEARTVTISDVDFARNTLTVRKTKNGDERVIPLIQAARELMEELAPFVEADQPLMPLVDPKKSFAAASLEAGVPKITPHKLRHIFATRCIEAGVDFRTVAGWLGHRDNGITLMRRYSHLRNEHGQRMAKMV